MGGEKRLEKSLRIGVHHADAVVWGPTYRTHLIAGATFEMVAGNGTCTARFGRPETESAGAPSLAAAAADTADADDAVVESTGCSAGDRRSVSAAAAADANADAAAASDALAASSAAAASAATFAAAAANGSGSSPPASIAGAAFATGAGTTSATSSGSGIGGFATSGATAKVSRVAGRSALTASFSAATRPAAASTRA